MSNQMQKYNFDVKIDGVLREYEVLADSEDRAMQALLTSLRSSAELSGRSGWVVVIIAGVAIAIYLWHKKIGEWGRSLFGRGTTDNGGAVIVLDKNQKTTPSDDMLDDGPQEPEDPWPWVKVMTQEWEGLAAGPIEDVDKSFKIFIFSNADPASDVRGFVRPYVPKTDDSEETAGVVVFWLDLDKFGQIELPASGSFDAVLADDAEANEKYQYADVKAQSVPELLDGLKKIAGESLAILWMS